MSTPATSSDPAAILARLRELLFALTRQSDPNPFANAAAILDDVDLASAGITSIDFLEFALSVEQEFGVAILDSIEPNELPLTLADWQKQISTRLAGG
jgi:acyl carrier protein